MKKVGSALRRNWQRNIQSSILNIWLSKPGTGLLSRQKHTTWTEVSSIVRNAPEMRSNTCGIDQQMDGVQDVNKNRRSVNSDPKPTYTEYRTGVRRYWFTICAEYWSSPVTSMHLCRTHPWMHLRRALWTSWRLHTHGSNVTKNEGAGCLSRRGVNSFPRCLCDSTAGMQQNIAMDNDIVTP